MNTMKTLLDKLKPEHKAKLEAEKELYGIAIDLTLKDLSENELYLKLSYLTINSLAVFLELKDYSPKTISQLFESE